MGSRQRKTRLEDGVKGLRRDQEDGRSRRFPSDGINQEHVAERRTPGRQTDGAKQLEQD